MVRVDFFICLNIIINYNNIYKFVSAIYEHGDKYNYNRD